MTFRKGAFGLLLLSAVLFLVWRFVRPLDIFVVEERFERPIHVKIPEGLQSISAKECGECHEEIYREWAGSMHAQAWTDPYFQVDYRYDGSRQICQNCHIPLENQQTHLVLGFRDRAKYNPILRANPDYDPELQAEGVTCAVCHIRGDKIVGPFETTDAPHPVTADPGMRGGMEYCRRCHVVPGNRWDTCYRIPPCGTVAEIREGDQEPDCTHCHMPAVVRPVAKGMKARRGRKHLFYGGHSPEFVRKALDVAYSIWHRGRRSGITVTLTNTGAAHYLPTGTPDRHLTLEFRVLDGAGRVLKKKTVKMKRHILWRPFIVDLMDTRLPHGIPKRYVFDFDTTGDNSLMLEMEVRYHFLEEKRRKRIGYENREPISYTIHEISTPVKDAAGEENR